MSALPDSNPNPMIADKMHSIITLRPRGELSIAWWVTALAMALITVGTVGGNCAVLFALRKVRRAPAHYPLASLATADLMLGVLVLPVAAARDLFVFHLNWAICSCWSTLDVLCCTASILSICTLGWERWSGITNPFARARRARRARLLAALVWPVSVCVALPTAFIPSPKHFFPGEIPKACSVNTNVGYVFFSTSLSFYVPASVMIFLYSRILRALASVPQIRAHRGGSPSKSAVKAVAEAALTSAVCSCPAATTNDTTQPTNKLYQLANNKSLHLPSSDKACPESPNNNPGSAGGIISRQRRATRTIIMLMGLFLFCWTPFFVMLPIDSLCECVRDGMWQLCTWLGYTNSALNPMVYAASSPAVGRALHASLTSTACTRTSEIPLTPQRPMRRN